MIELEYCKHLDDEANNFANEKHNLALSDHDIDIAHIFERDHFFGLFSTKKEDFDIKQTKGHKKLDKPAEVEKCSECNINEAHAINMSCGHGGLCYECSLKHWRHHDVCHICKLPIEYVLEIDPNYKSSIGITKISKKALPPTRMPKYDDFQKSIDSENCATNFVLSNQLID